MEPLSFNPSINNTEKTSVQDKNAPFSYAEWVSRLAFFDNNESLLRYNEYVQNWIDTNASTTKTFNLNLRQKYLRMVEQLDLIFDTKEKTTWYQQANLLDDNELLLSIPYFAKKLKQLTLHYLKARKNIKKTKIVANSVGSNVGVEQTIKNHIVDFLTKKYNQNYTQEYETDLAKQIKNEISVQIEELYDDKQYFDISPTLPINHYVDLNHESNLSLLETNQINLSAIESLVRAFNIDPNVSYEDYFLSLVGINFNENTTEELYQEFIKKYLGNSKNQVTITNSQEISSINYSIPISEGNNFFYYPYGESTPKKITETPFLSVNLKDIDFQQFVETDVVNPKFPTAGTSLEDSDIIFTKIGNEIKSAWLYNQQFTSFEVNMQTYFARDTTTVFIYPFPGFGLSGHNYNWTGFDYKYNSQYEFLAKPFKQAIQNKYWESDFPIFKTDSILINESSLIEDGALAHKHPYQADQIFIRNERSTDAKNPFIKPNGAWLYKHTHTHFPLHPSGNNFLLWPFNILNEFSTVNAMSAISLAANFGKISSNQLADIVKIKDLNSTFFVAGDSILNSDNIYKFDENMNIIEMAWLSGKSVIGEDYSFVSQNSFVGDFQPGTFVKFIWTGPDNTPISNVFTHTPHRNDCPLMLNSRLDWNKCSCKQVYYSPYGHSEQTFLAGHNKADFICLLNKPFEKEIDLNFWKDINGKLIYESETSFTWYQTDKNSSWGYGKWVSNFGSSPPFTLRTGKAYVYYRTIKTKNNTKNCNYVVNFPFKPTKQNIKPVWIAGVKNAITQNWESSNEPSNMLLIPGDIYKIELAPQTRNYALSSFSEITINSTSIFDPITITGYNLRDLINIGSSSEDLVFDYTKTTPIPNIPSSFPGTRNTEKTPDSDGCENIKTLWSTYDLIPVVCYKENGGIISWPTINNVFDIEKYKDQLPFDPDTKKLITVDKISKIRWEITDITNPTQNTSYFIDDVFAFDFIPPQAGIYKIKAIVQFNTQLSVVNQPLITTDLNQTKVADPNLIVDYFPDTQDVLETKNIITTPLTIPIKETAVARLSTIAKTIPAGWPVTNQTYEFNGIPNIVALEPFPFTKQGNQLENLNLTRSEIETIINTADADKINKQFLTKTTYSYSSPSIKTSTNVWPTTKTIVMNIDTPRPGFVLEQLLYGWDYIQNKRKKGAIGARPYWAVLDANKNSTTRGKGVYSWGYPDEYLYDYLPNNKPLISPLTFNIGNVIEYNRKGLPLQWNQVITAYEKANKFRWCKIHTNIKDPSNLSNLYLTKKHSDPIAIPTLEDTDIVLSNVINSYPVGIYYYALKNFTWNIQASKLTPDEAIAESKEIYVASEPWKNISNQYYPTIATIPFLDETYKVTDVGGYFTPKHLGTSVLFNRNYSSYLKQMSAESSSYINSTGAIIAGGRGLTKQNQYSVYGWTENNEWVKEPYVVNMLAGSPKRELTKTLQTFIPYQSNSEDTALGLVTEQSILSPWGGKNDNEWIDKTNENRSFTGVLNVSSWNKTQITADQNVVTNNWVSDIYGNQYELHKPVSSTNNINYKNNIGGSLWIKTNGGTVLNASYVLSAALFPLEHLIDIYDDLTNKQQIQELDCYGDILFLKTPTATSFIKLFYSYDTDMISSITDFTNIRTLNPSLRFEQNYFLQKQKKIITLFTSISANAFIPELWETNTETLETLKIYPATNEKLTEWLDASLELDIQTTNTGKVSYNEENDAFLLTYFTNSSANSLSLLDLTITNEEIARLTRVDFYTNLGHEEFIGDAPLVNSDYQKVILITEQPFEVKVYTQNNPNVLTLLEYQEYITASITNHDELTFKSVAPLAKGIHQISYEISNLVGSSVYALTLNVS